MKRMILIVLCLLPVFFVEAQETKPISGPVITWAESTYDFGDIMEGDKVSHTFKFTNTGNSPLVLTNVEVTCGCTTPNGWPRDPIAHGATGELTVAFNSTGKSGKQHKVINIVSNSVGTTNQVMIMVNVLAKKQSN
ncbi:MAG: DUF1573 domain-containing protein [Cyclobacteriaceae bacterium]|nr:DUF1573 domain-containing protein [Cyclobacteriaceae bacterium]